jgi:hypothetical protein
MTPSHFGYTVIILQGLSFQSQGEDSLYCLYVSTNQSRLEYYEDNMMPARKCGVYRNHYYYEYLYVRQREVGVIFGESLHKVTGFNSVPPMNKNGELTDVALSKIVEGFLKVTQRPLTNWNLKKDCNVFINTRTNLLKEMAVIKAVSNCERLQHHLSFTASLRQYEGELAINRAAMSTTTREKMDDFNSKVKTLVAYNYIDREMNLLFKGKVAMDIVSTDKILTTELLFSGLLKNLTIEECIALFSVLNSQVRANRNANPCEGDISENFDRALRYLTDQTTKLIQVEMEQGVVDMDREVETRLNFYFYELMYAWANKESFSEVVRQCPFVDEGSIVKMVNTVERICQ